MSVSVVFYDQENNISLTLMRKFIEKENYQIEDMQNEFKYQ